MVNMKINELDQKTLLASKKFDKYEEEKYKALNPNNKEDFSNFNFLDEIKNLSKIDNNYRKKLDKRMDILMEKIDTNINSNNYSELSTILSNYKNISYNSLHNIKGNNNNTNINNKLKENIITSNENKNIIEKKEKQKEIINKKNIIIKDIININKTDNKIKKDKILEEESFNDIKDNEEIRLNKSEIFPTKVQIICKRENEINNKILKKNRFLENEVNYLKFKLKNIEKQKDFLQEVIRTNPNIKKSLFDIFLVNYFKNIALNWKEISDEIIDELIIDEIHELTQIKLKLRNVKREEEKRENNLGGEIDNKYISPIEMEEFLLFNDNLKSIKTVIRSVKESERNLCKKYKVKIKNNFK